MLLRRVKRREFVVKEVIVSARLCEATVVGVHNYMSRKKTMLRKNELWRELMECFAKCYNGSMLRLQYHRKTNALELLISGAIILSFGPRYLLGQPGRSFLVVNGCRPKPTRGVRLGPPAQYCSVMPPHAERLSSNTWRP